MKMLRLVVIAFAYPAWATKLLHHAHTTSPEVCRDSGVGHSVQRARGQSGRHLQSPPR